MLESWEEAMNKNSDWVIYSNEKSRFLRIKVNLLYDQWLLQKKIYCLKCQKDTETKNLKVWKTNKGRVILLLK